VFSLRGRDIIKGRIKIEMQQKKEQRKVESKMVRKCKKRMRKTGEKWGVRTTVNTDESRNGEKKPYSEGGCWGGYRFPTKICTRPL
jgi:hypothetical protein